MNDFTLSCKIMNTYKVKLLDRKEVARDTLAFFFEKPSDFQYQAGQFIRILLPEALQDDSRGNIRSFSLGSAPFEPTLMTAMRMTGSLYKKALRDYPLGTTVSLLGPLGKLTLPSDSERPLVFIVGGIGIVPIRSFILDQMQCGFSRDIFLFYACRFLEDAAFFEEIHSISSEQFTMVTTLTNQERLPQDWNGEFGRVNIPLLQKYLQKSSLTGNDMSLAPLYFVVGVPEMVTSLRSVLIDAGVYSQDIYFELFTGYK